MIKNGEKKKWLWENGKRVRDLEIGDNDAKGGKVELTEKSSVDYGK